MIRDDPFFWKIQIARWRNPNCDMRKSKLRDGIKVDTSKKSKLWDGTKVDKSKKSKLRDGIVSYANSPNCEMEWRKMENIQIAKWNLGIIEKVQIERYNPKL